MLYSEPASTLSFEGLSTAMGQRIRQQRLEIYISPVNGRSISRIMKTAQATGGAQTNRATLTVALRRAGDRQAVTCSWRFCLFERNLVLMVLLLLCHSNGEDTAEQNVYRRPGQIFRLPITFYKSSAKRRKL